MIVPEPSPAERYLTNELFAVAPLPPLEGKCGQFKMQITSERGKTKWLNITPEQFRVIEQVLLNGIS